MTDAERAARAAEAINNPALAEAWTALRDAYLRALRACDAKDDLGRYRMSVALNVVDAVEAHLRAAVTTGQLDDGEAADLATPRRRWIPKF
ncbi:MAG: hypothetical protein KDE14_07395 [Rhodobacteraceae bacterium]|nr:hypothetical protein [Paracoccaceae bacterium]